MTDVARLIGKARGKIIDEILKNIYPEEVTIWEERRKYTIEHNVHLRQANFVNRPDSHIRVEEIVVDDKVIGELQFDITGTKEKSTIECKWVPAGDPEVAKAR